MTRSLAKEIDHALSLPSLPDAYSVRFKHYFLGYPIRFGDWKRKGTIRLFRKSRCYYTDREVHEAIAVPSACVGKLTASLLHFTCTSLDRWFGKKYAYAAFGANELAKQGRKTRVVDLLVRPILRFVVGYFSRLGFLDGVPGLIVAIDGAFWIYLKYALLWELQQGQKSLPSQHSFRLITDDKKCAA